MKSLLELSIEIDMAYWQIKNATRIRKIPTPRKVGSIWIYD